jgi:hypothetical protein
MYEKEQAMSTLCKAYSDEDAARRAVDALRAAGVPGHDIRLVTGHPLHDVRSEPVGSFAGTLAPDAPVGTFAGGVRLRCQGNGTFAGSADRQRQGCFADVDRDVIVGYANAAAHARVAGDHALQRLLRRRHVAPDAARGVVDDLRGGRAVVVAEIAEIGPSEVRARLERLEQAS